MGLLTIYEISLDVAKNNYVVIKAKQHDQNSRRVVVHCTNNGQEYVLTSDVKAIVQMRKPDETIFNADCTVDVSANVVMFNMTKQMTSVSGVSDAEIVLVKSSDNQVLSTMKFSVVIIPSSVTSEDIYSADEFGTLANLIIGYDEAKVTVETIEEEMKTWVSEEQVRQIDENTRISNENTRISNENTRKSAETARSSAEATRNSNENSRISAEASRENTEAIRVKNESARESSEAIRKTNEDTRIAAEAQREALKETVETKLANGEFDGKTVLYGDGIPAKSLGRIGDVYINTSHLGMYPQYLFTKDGEDWTPRWKTSGLDGSDTLPILGTMFYPDTMEIPDGYEIADDCYISSESIKHGDSTLPEYFSSLLKNMVIFED